MICHRFSLRCGALGFLFVVIFGHNLSAQDDSGGSKTGQTTTVAADLQTTINQYTTAYDTGDVDQVMSFWAEQSDFVDIHGEFHEGRDLIAALFRRGFAENPGRTMKLESAARKFLTPEVAMDDGILELTGVDGAKHRGRYTVVWTKVDGKWLIRSARDIPVEIENRPAVAEEQRPPIEELAWLVGKWKATSEEVEVALDSDWTLDKRFLVQTFDVKSSDDQIRVVVYIAFDPIEGCFRSWFFDSHGGFGRGTWARINDLYDVASELVLPDGQLGSLLMTWEPIDDNTIQWQATQRDVGGESLPDMKLTYARVK